MLRRLWWLWILVLAGFTQVLEGNRRLGWIEWRVYDSVLTSARSPGWDGVRMVALPPELEPGAAVYAKIASRLLELGATTVAIDDVILRGDHGIAELAALCDRLVLAAVPAPSAPDDPDALGDILLDVGTIPPGVGDFRVEDLWTPPPELRRRCAVGVVTRKMDVDGTTRSEEVVSRVAGHDRGLPSLALATFARHRGADLETLRYDGSVLHGERLRVRTNGGEVFLDLRSADNPLLLTAGYLFDAPNEAVLRQIFAGSAVFVFRNTQDDYVVLPDNSLALGSYLHAYAFRRYATGAPFVYVSWPALLAVTILTLGLVRWRPRAAPSRVAITAGVVLFLIAGMQVMILEWWGLYVRVASLSLFIVLAGLLLGLLSATAVTKRMKRAEARADAAIAPKGRIALVFTDVQGSTRLWEKAPTVMRAALQLHNDLFRRFLEELGGYEVKTEGDAFMVAFQEPVEAVRWCLDVQRSLVSLDWPPELTALEDAREVRDEQGGLAFHGLRVRMGVHVGEPQEVPDPRSGRMDYFGPVVNRAARVSGSAHGGQILLSGDAWKEIEPRLVSLGLVRTRDLGQHLLKGLDDPERLVEILPEAFRGRSFPPPKTESASKAG